MSHGPASSFAVDALTGPVTVHRDDYAIAHIKTGSMKDAFIAQGFVHAQDRMWLMDSARRQMQGRWSEWVGPAGIEADKIARRLGATAASKRDYEALGGDARTMVDAYADGVNAYLAQGDPLPLEYQLLGEEVEPWEGWHCVAAMRQRGFLIGTPAFKLWRAAALAVLSPEDITKLRWDDGGKERLLVPPGAETDHWIASLKELRPAIDAMAHYFAPDATGGGSNNWSVSGERTASGRPILAGDPHRVFEMPSMYYQMHLASDEFDTIGLTVPGVPGFPHFAHNGKVAWGVTIAFADFQDFYVEKFKSDDSTMYLYKDEWLPAETSTETIAVRGQSDVAVDIVRTRHGAVVAGDVSGGTALTLKSIQIDPLDRSLDCLLPMLTAKTCDELFTATKGWGLYDHNLVAADTDGHIGHLVRAIIPRRPATNGWLPVPGWTGEYEWDGTIPWEAMPRVDDPPRGYIATANNRVVDRATTSGDYFTTDSHPPNRVRRIESLLDGLPRATLEDMSPIHHDSLSIPALLIQSKLKSLNPDDAALRKVVSAIASWDCRMDGESVAATLYAHVRRHLAAIVLERSGLGAVVGTSLTKTPPGVSPVDQLWWSLPNLLRADDVSLLGGWDWSQALTESVRRTAAESDPAPWKEDHRAALTHPLAAVFPDADLSPQGAPIGGDNDTVWANGCSSTAAFHGVTGAVARYVFDVGDWDNSTWIVLSGVSGDPRSPHYLDQHDKWSRCELIPMTYSWAAIEQTCTSVSLNPTRER
ncbi:penicillin amidase [Antricoccus suffuscus]|uniref:Penicillin amidase n=1 Tax=Antricoccus suffuscus TaxID=1629062 RepID=A0A2T0YZI4_9ACTN|nr:penicillin acylase family protein [Antricoccus suffuscus]PRZ29501.1 penicillin amidase [Antricoccus suffuscus]